MLDGAIQLPDGAWIRGRGLRKPLPEGETPEYGLYLGAKNYDPPWPYDVIDWPDFRLPRDRALALELIKALHEKALAGQRVEVACGGGVGRTGTVIAHLAILAGVDRTEAVAWARQHHHRWAVETPWQRRWVERS